MDHNERFPISGEAPLPRTVLRTGHGGVERALTSSNLSLATRDAMAHSSYPVEYPLLSSIACDLVAEGLPERLSELHIFANSSRPSSPSLQDDLSDDTPPNSSASSVNIDPRDLDNPNKELNLDFLYIYIREVLKRPEDANTKKHQVKESVRREQASRLIEIMGNRVSSAYLKLVNRLKSTYGICRSTDNRKRDAKNKRMFASIIQSLCERIICKELARQGVIPYFWDELAEAVAEIIGNIDEEQKRAVENGKVREVLAKARAAAPEQMEEKRQKLNDQAIGRQQIKKTSKRGVTLKKESA